MGLGIKIIDLIIGGSALFVKAPSKANPSFLANHELGMKQKPMRASLRSLVEKILEHFLEFTGCFVIIPTANQGANNERQLFFSQR